MNDDTPRRRRSTEEPTGNGGGRFPIFPLVLVVIFAGLLLGGLLAHFFSARTTSQNAPSAAPTAFATIAAIAPAPASTPTAIPTIPATPHASPRPTHAASATPSPTATSSPTAKPAATVKPMLAAAKPTPAAIPRVVAIVTPRAVGVAHPIATAHTVVATPAPATSIAALNTAVPNYQPSGTDGATAVVRSYLGALARGDRSTATSYLMRGVPSEGFMDANSRILSVQSHTSGSQQYKVTADVSTATGEYYITFTVEQGAGGLQIADHYAIKVQ